VLLSRRDLLIMTGLRLWNLAVCAVDKVPGKVQQACIEGL
jgi:hypothetical protein